MLSHSLWITLVFVHTSVHRGRVHVPVSLHVRSMEAGDIEVSEHYMFWTKSHRSAKRREGGERRVQTVSMAYKTHFLIWLFFFFLPQSLYCCFLT